MKRTILGMALLFGGCGPIGAGRAAPNGAGGHALQTNLFGLGYNYVPQKHNAFSILGSAATGTNVSDAGVLGLPSSVDNSTLNPPVGNQGGLGSCVAWSAAYGLGGYLANQAQLGAMLYSPMFIYTQASAGCPDCGMDIDQALGFMQAGLEQATAYDASPRYCVLEELGCTTGGSFEDFGASVPGLGDDASANNLGPPLPSDLQSSAGQRLTTFQKIYDTDPSSAYCAGSAGAGAAIQLAISQGYPVVIGLPVFPEFDGYDSVHPVQPPSADEQPRGGHAILCTRYDPTGLWCQNSWGAGWGNAGSVELSWPFVEQCLFEADLGAKVVAGGPVSPAIVPTISSPATGTSISGTTEIDLSVAIPAGAGAITAARIEALNIGPIGQATSQGSGYSLQLDTTQFANGWFGLVAVVEDSQGNLYQSTIVELQVANLTPQITAPLADAVLTGTTQVSGTLVTPLAMQYWQTVVDSPCATVTLNVDGSSVGTAAAYPGGIDTGNGAYQPQTFSYLLDPTLLSNGPHTLGAVCIDTQGQSHPGPAVAVNVDLTFSVQLVSPTAGSTVSGFTNVVASLPPTGPSVQTLTFELDGVSFAQVGSSQLSVLCDTSKVSNGPHVLTVVANGTHQQWSSAPVDVTVVGSQLEAGSIQIVEPAGGSVVSGPVSVAAQVSMSMPTTEASVPISAGYYLDGASFGSTLSMTVGNSQLGSVAAPIAPMLLETSALADGSHTLTAVVTDDSNGLTWTSAPVNVTVANEPISVQLIAPAAGSTVSGVVTVTAALSGAGSPAGPLTFLANGWLIGMGSTSVSWDTTPLPDLPYVLTAIATDAAGNQWISPGLTVSVSNAHSVVVQLASPAAGSAVSGQVAVTASLPTVVGTQVTSLAFDADGYQFGTATAAAPSCSWNTAGLSNGSHVLQVFATDSFGNSYSSAPVGVTVANNLFHFASPTAGSTVSGWQVPIQVSLPTTQGLAGLTPTTVVTVRVYADGTDVADAYNASASSVYLGPPWDTTQLSNGPHTLSFTVTSAGGLVWNGVPITVTVAN